MTACSLRFQQALVPLLQIKTRGAVMPGLTTTTATPVLSRETPTKETHETPEMDIQKRLKRLSVRTRETLKRLKSAGVGQWWLVWVSGARQWVLGSSKAANAVGLAVFDSVTFCSSSQMAEFTLRLRLVAHR
jgi:hypothetical protein